MMGKKLTQDEFIIRCKNVHGDKYDYSLVEYKNSKDKIKIICPKHGIFEQISSKHLIGRGCIKCAGNFKSTTDDFIKKAKLIHNNNFDYSLVEYVNVISKVKIICSEHGIFEQKPNGHLNGYGCPKCACKYMNNDDFIKKANKIHNNRYDYSLINYITSHKKIKIICKEHGVFEQTPNSHLNGSGCKKCQNNPRIHNKNYYINTFKKIHNDKYDYSLLKDGKLKTNEKIQILCPTHGLFEQKIKSHLEGSGCMLCSGKKNKTSEEFIKDAKRIHKDKYNYNLVEYKNANTKIKIICKKHGVFEQTPRNHLSKQGCPNCNNSKGEIIINNFLKNKKIIYKKEKTFTNCYYLNNLRFDFYIKDYNLCIEYDGIQHFKPIDYWGGKKGLKEQKIKDKIKNDFCKREGINLLRIKYDENIEEKLNNYFKPT